MRTYHSKDEISRNGNENTSTSTFPQNENFFDDQMIMEEEEYEELFLIKNIMSSEHIRKFSLKCFVRISDS